ASLIPSEHITYSANRMNQSLLSTFFELLSKHRNIYFQHIRLPTIVKSPDPFHDHLFRQHLTRTLHEYMKQIKLSRCQFYPTLSPERLSRISIDQQIFVYELRAVS